MFIVRINFSVDIKKNIQHKMKTLICASRIDKSHRLVSNIECNMH